MRDYRHMSETTRLVTAEELEKFPDDDYRYELVAGRVIRMSPVEFSHGTIVARCLFLLGRHLEGRNLGALMTQVGFKLASNPDTVRAPDVAFIRQSRIPSSKPRGFWKGPPDFAIEVLSPNDRPREIAEKVEEYLRSGVPLVVVIDPDETTISVFRPSSSPVTLRGMDDLLELDDAVAGFRCTLGDIFG